MLQKTAKGIAMIIVTGGAGFIGSNLVRALNNLGEYDILVVDNLTNGHKFQNLVDCQVKDYCDKNDFFNLMRSGAALSDDVDVVFHQGACSVTTEWDGRYMLNNNYEFSKTLFHYCQKREIPFIYASSAAIYGLNKNSYEHPRNEHPLNVYGYSKLLFDQYLRHFLDTAKSQVVGLRYFNVYGPREGHKGSMASVIWHFNQQMQKERKIKLFGAYGGYAAGEHLRDFVYVDDIVAANLWFWRHPDKGGIYNVGTGKARSFNDVAREVVAWYQGGEIEYIPFPEHLAGSYQSFTQADLNALHGIGYKDKFTEIESGVKEYLDWLNVGKKQG
jgi:ADP-L-glycero-D-manno-heptose 6-epimerase